MSKLSFRARALDASKPLPVYHADDLPDLSEYNAINRAVPEMPTGMEKEEESEHHLQRAMAAQQLYGGANQLVIPTPEFDVAAISDYNNVYSNKYSVPRNYIRMHGLMLDVDYPEYDLDDEDEAWCQSQDGLTSLKLESMIEILEKSLGQQSLNLSLAEAQVLLRGNDEDLVVNVFDYWQAKRARLKIPLIAAVKQEKRDGSSSTDYYVAFRRRTEKMQTRKNRKNDEASFERMCKLRRDLERSCQLLALLKERERKKQELVDSARAVFCQRYKMKDWDYSAYNGVIEQLFRPPPPVVPPHPSQTQPAAMMQHMFNQQIMQLGYGNHGLPGMPGTDSMSLSMATSGETSAIDSTVSGSWSQQPAVASDGDVRQPKTKEKHSSKRKHHKKKHHTPPPPQPPQPPVEDPQVPAEEATVEEAQAPAPLEAPIDLAEGAFPFKRRLHVQYCSPRNTLTNYLPFDESYPDIPSNKRYRLYLTSMGRSGPFIGLSRCRVGRGGRRYVDRGSWPFGGDSDLEHSILHGLVSTNDVISEKNSSLDYYQLDSPPPAKRVAYPPSPTREPPSGQPLSCDLGDMSGFAHFPITPSTSGDEDRKMAEEDDEEAEEEEDEEWGNSVFDFGNSLTSVRLTSILPSGVVHRPLESDSGLESIGVSPLSDDNPSQSSGKHSSASVSPLTDNEGLTQEKSRTAALPQSELRLSQTPPSHPVASQQDSQVHQSSNTSTDYLSVLSRTTATWRGPSPPSPAIQRVPQGMPNHPGNGQSPIPSVLKVL